MIQTLNIIGDIQGALSNFWDSITGFFGDVGKIITTMKNLIASFFTFVSDTIGLIPSPFGEIIFIVLTIISVIFIIKIVGVILW